VGKPAPPAAHAVWVHADQPSDLPVRQALGGQQHDLGAGGVALRGVVCARTRRRSSARSASVRASGGKVDIWVSS
jgi:hypothetical protein